MSIPDNLITLFNSPPLQAAANASQLASLGLTTLTLSNTELLLKIHQLFQEQDREKLDIQFEVLIKSIIQNEKILAGQEIIKAQNEEIIALLKKEV